MKNSLIELTPVSYSTNAIKVLEFHAEANAKCFRLHWHDRIEILRVRSGKMTVEHGTSKTELHSGELTVMPPKSLHRGYTTSSDVDYDVLMFDVRSYYNDTELCKSLLPAIFDNRAVFKNVINDPETLAAYDHICQSAVEPSLEVTSSVYRFLHLLYKNNLIVLREPPKKDPIKRVITYLEENYAQDISNDTLCRQFGYTPSHLCRKFKGATGLTPMNYLKIYRLELARKKLRSSDLSVSEIAEECGFSDANYFTRCFKSHFEATPTKYKKQ